MREREVGGFSIGAGMMLVIAGAFGWFHTNYILDRVSYSFELAGIDITRHYLIADLNTLMWTYGCLIALGIISLLYGWYILRREKGKAVQA